MKFRAIVERLSRGRVFRRKVITRHGRVTIFVSPDAQLKYMRIGKNALDEDLVHIANCVVQGGDVVWDIGANVGVFSASCSARMNVSVLAIEADSWLSGLIRRTIALPEYTHRNFKILTAAVSNTDGASDFLIAKRGRASNALVSAGGRSQMGGAREVMLVPTLTIDTIAKSLGSPSFIKIDIEGAELAALQGAAKTLLNIRPILYVEIGAMVFHECVKLMSGFEYNCFDARGKETNDERKGNYFFIPNENSEARARISRLATTS
ncbi:FkbM family methyltransferase [Mesorhizobium sp.]|uniref:FkbM family methyltransferase n=1 Tax=Mesorhizobium sp. TaxID=1871066 RepID=UPI000FE4FA97|nr:FkbM family methyltransferase [Mesorhizobium sp.]RWE64168.1 MAG: FkbM family methyltransferase [Mesorhizobium sp.]